MSRLKRVDKRKYIDELFNNLSMLKNISVIIKIKEKKNKTALLFSARRGKSSSIVIENADIYPKRGENITIFIDSTEISLFFKATVASQCFNNSFNIEQPKKVYVYFKEPLARLSRPSLKPFEYIENTDIEKILKQSDFFVKHESKMSAENISLNLCKVRNNNLIFFGLSYKPDSEHLALGTVLRVYDKTFVGQEAFCTEKVKYDSRSWTNIYAGIADDLLLCPYFKYFIMYILKENKWQVDVISEISKFINSQDKCFVDTNKYYECDTMQLLNSNIINKLECIVPENPKDFYEYCKNILQPLIVNAYGYNEDDFFLDKIKQVYEAYGYFKGRRLFCVKKDGEIVAFAIAETSSDILNFNMLNDNCRLYFANIDAHADDAEILRSILPEIAKFYHENGKDEFYILTDAAVCIDGNYVLHGMKFKGDIQRIVMDRRGMIEYKALLNWNFINLEKYYKLTHPQLAIWYTEKMYHGTSFSNIASSIRLHGDIGYTFLESAINLFIEKNDGIRLRIVENSDMPMQYISEYNYLNVDFFDFSNAGGEDGLSRFIESNIYKPFNYVDNDLYYFAMYKINEHEGGFYFKLHHLISDGWSGVSMINKIVEYYSMLKEGAEVNITSRSSYLDFIHSEEEFNNSKKFKILKEFWDNKFSTIPECCSIKPRTGRLENTRSERTSFTLSKELTKGIIKYCEEAKVSPFTVFLAALYMYIYRIFSKNDIVIGTPVINRSNVREKGTFGMFVDVIPVRLKVDPDMSFSLFTQYVSKELMGFLKNQKYPLDLILKDYRERHKVSDNLFDISLSYQNMKLEKTELTGNYSMKWHFNKSQTDALQIHVSDRESEGQYELDFDYLVDVFDSHEIGGIYEHYANLLKDGISYPHKKLNKLELLTSEEKNEILYRFNKTEVDYPCEKTIHQLFEEQVEKTPDSIAVVFDKESLTYMELNAKSNQLAGILREKGVGKDTIVGLAVERSIEMIIGILGILKAGGAYLPIDIDYPPERINYMISDSYVNIILSKGDLDGIISKDGFDIIDLNDESIFNLVDSNILESYNLVNINNPCDLAYIIYTSGSTGKPKGVMIEHKGIANLKVFFENVIGVGRKEHILQFASSSFDASVWEIFMSLLNGATLYIVQKEIINNYLLFEKYLNDNLITIATLPPTYAAHLNPSNIKYLKKLITAGSAISKELMHIWKGYLEYFNAYGPTETTICATIWKYNEEEDRYSSVPIGKPICNLKAYILDNNNELVPVGIAGELCISGCSLSRGYLNKAELTESKFINNPFEDGEKLYKTGDLARWLPDGNIEFLGRIDHQMKIRGFRIEPGEIENQLITYKGVKEAVVIDNEDKNGDKYLQAYFVADREIEISDLKNHLKQNLPDFMIPAYLICVDNIPLTPNGKVDRKALAEVKLNSRTEIPYEAPRNKAEEILAELWCNVLETENIGINENFFELGGDSIGAIQVITGLQKKGFTVETKDLYKHPTIAELARVLRINDIKVNQGIIEGRAKLTPIQKWFFEQKLTEMNYFNQAFMLYSRKGFDGNIVQNVFGKILEHHDALRMVYIHGNSGFSQKNRGTDGNLFEFKVFDFTKGEDFLEKIQEEAIRIQESMDIEKGPLVKVGLFKTYEGDHLLIAIHHLVIDGVSWRTILEDFNEGYEQELARKPIQFQPKTTSFKEWADRIAEYSNDNIFLKEKEFWLSLEKNIIKPLPKDFGVSHPKRKNDLNININFNADETEKLLKFVHTAYKTDINDVLLTALGLAVKDWTGENKILINLEGHGREGIISGVDLTRTVGWFTTAFPVVLDMKNSNDLSLQVKSIKEQLRHVPNKGIGYGILKYLTNEENKEDMVFSLKPEINFNYLGQFDQIINKNFYELSFLSPGPMISSNSERLHSIDINGMVVNGLMTFTLSYSSMEYREETMLKFTRSFKEYLCKIMNHCLNVKTTELTPYDFGDEELSLEELDEIMNLISSISD